MGIIKGAGRLTLYGSTRYTSHGSKRKAPRLKAYASTVGAGMVGGGVGGALGAATHAAFHGSAETHRAASQVGSLIGGHIGVTAGRRFAAKRGYIRRDKQRMTLRATGSSHFKADRRF